MADAFRFAVGTLTAVPVRAPSRTDGGVAGRAMLLAPLIGALLGGTAAAVFWVASRAGLPVLVGATLAVSALALLTRGLHLDGLADTADGLASSYLQERSLAVMRTGDTGPAGTATVVLVLLLQVAALAVAGPVAVLLASVVGRAGLALACARGVPSARESGLGATVAGTVSRPAATLVMLAVIAAAGLGWRPWYQGVIAAAAGLVMLALLVVRAVRRFGGITGDVLGAGVEVATATALVVLAAG